MYEHSDRQFKKILVNCSRFIGPLQIKQRTAPTNYANMLKILQTYSSFDLKNNWVKLLTDQFNGKADDILFQNDQFMTTYVSSPTIRWMFFSMFFTILTMIFIYFMFSISKNLTSQVAKFIKFRKYYLAYTIIPVYCCIMIISMTVTFGQEATQAGFSIRNAENWKNTAINKNNYLRRVTMLEFECSIVLPKLDETTVSEVELQVFGTSSADINELLMKNGEKPLTQKLISFLLPAVKFYVKKLSNDTFEEVNQVVRRTHDLLRIPSETIIDTAKYIIFVVSAISICFTVFICLMVFLDLKNNYPIIVTLIQLFSPILLLFIIIGYFFILYIFTSIVGSYTVYSHLINPEIHEYINFERYETRMFFESLTTLKNFESAEMDQWKYFKDVKIFDFTEFLTLDVIERIVKTNGDACFEDFTCLYFTQCLDDPDECKKDVYELIVALYTEIDVWPVVNRDFGIQSKSYLRYLSFFKQNTFVPIASLVWKILPLPFLIFFNLIFIHFATPLIRDKNEDSSSDGLM